MCLFRIGVDSFLLLDGMDWGSQAGFGMENG